MKDLSDEKFNQIMQKHDQLEMEIRNYINLCSNDLLLFLFAEIGALGRNPSPSLQFIAMFAHYGYLEQMRKLREEKNDAV